MGILLLPVDTSCQELHVHDETLTELSATGVLQLGRGLPLLVLPPLSGNGDGGDCETLHEEECAIVDFQRLENAEDMGIGMVLLVDDEPKVCDLLRVYLEQAGYEVACVQDGGVALQEIERRNPALVLLDLNLPGMDGLELCRSLRKSSNVPIIMLTARDEEADRIVGLEIGADDYVTKPFSPREVVARVKAVLRRRDTASQDMRPIEMGTLLVDAPRHEATYRGKALPLTSREFAIIEFLARNPGRVFSRALLLDRVFGIDFEGYERTIDAHIKNIRQKLLEIEPDSPTPLMTVRGVGYKLEPGGNAKSGA